MGTLKIVSRYDHIIHQSWKREAFGGCWMFFSFSLLLVTNLGHAQLHRVCAPTHHSWISHTVSCNVYLGPNGPKMIKVGFTGVIWL